MFRYFILLLLVACKTTPEPVPNPQELCTTLYDPHLCLITIDSTTFGGQGSNRCIALRNLRQALIENKHNPLLTEIAECGRVFK